MFCPKCKVEYENWAKECSDCKVTLVYKLPPEPKQESLKYKEVFSTYSQVEAVMIASILDSENITYIFNDNFQAGFSTGPMVLMVREDQVEKAMDLLKNCKLGSNTDEDLKEDKDIEDVKCDTVELTDNIDKDLNKAEDVQDDDYAITRLFRKKIIASIWLCAVAIISTLAIYKTSVFINYTKNILSMLSPLMESGRRTEGRLAVLIVFIFIYLFFKITFWAVKILKN